jgi:hypothetical protein
MAPTSFTQALERAARLATQALPETLHARLSDAVVLVRDGHCFQRDDGTWTVQSASDPAQTYTHVNGQCPCSDAQYNQPPKGLCKHRLAVYVARKTTALMTVAQTGTSVPADPHAPQAEVVTKCDNLPEARASLNFKALIGGFEVQLTLRDDTEAALLTRFAALRQRPEMRPIPRPAPRSGTWKRSNQGR